MPRKPLIRTHRFPYHITARSNNREWFYLPIDEIWQIIQTVLRKAQVKFDLEIIQFVLMSNHYHMLLRTPQSNIDTVMQFIQKNISDMINQETNRINHVFGGPYKWSLIDDPHYFHAVVKYIFQNPLRAGIVNKCEAYEYSTLYYLINDISLQFGHKLDSVIEYNKFDELIKYLNQQLSPDQVPSLKKALKKTRFHLTKNQNSGKIPTLAVNVSPHP